MDTAILPSEQEKKPPTLLERLLINRNYAYNWVGLATSRLGNVLFKISLLLWVATTLARNAPWAAFAIAGLVALPTGIFLLVSIFAGVYVDRWNSRRTQLFMDAARAIVFTLFLLATIIVPLFFPVGSEAANIALLVCAYIVVMFSSACDPFVNSSLTVLLYEIVEEPDLTRAFGRGQVLNNLGTILGPPLGAAIFFALGIQWTVFLDVLSFIVSYFAFFMIRLPPRAEEAKKAGEEGTKQENAFLKEFLDGVRFAFGNKLIISIAVAMMLNAIGAAGIGVFDLFFATNNLHTEPQIYAYLDVVMGVGAILGAIFLGPWLRPRIGVIRAYWISGLINGLLFLIYSRLTNLTAAFVVLFLMGLSQAVFSVAFGPIFFRATPRGMMGRVNSVLAQILTLTSLASTSLIPFLVAVVLRDKYLQISGLLFGPIDTLFMAVGILVVTSALYLRITLNHYTPLLKYPPGQRNALDPTPQVDTLPEHGRLSTLQKQISICVVGIIITILTVLPVALSASVNTVSSLELSRGHPATGQAINGMACQPALGTVQRASVRLTVYINGQQAALPKGVGSVAPPQPGVAALASNGKTSCLYPLHVFENDNIIHVDAPNNRVYTLGDFFDIWGQPLSRTQMADYSQDTSRTLTFHVFDESGALQPEISDPRVITLVEHKTIVILYNSPDTQPTPYRSWNGL